MKKKKIVRMGEVDDVRDYDEDTLFVLYDPPLRNPLKNKNNQTEEEEHG